MPLYENNQQPSGVMMQHIKVDYFSLTAQFFLFVLFLLPHSNSTTINMFHLLKSDISDILSIYSNI